MRFQAVCAAIKPSGDRLKALMPEADDALRAGRRAKRPGAQPLAMVLEPVTQHGSIFRVREVLIRQRTQLINAFRGHLTEFGQVVPQGTSNVHKLIRLVEDQTCGLPSEAMATLQVLILSLRHLEAEITRLDAEIAPVPRKMIWPGV